MNITKMVKELQSVMNLEFDERAKAFHECKEKLEIEVNNNPSNIQAFSLMAMINLELRNDTKISIDILEDCYNKNKNNMSKDRYSLWATNMAYLLSEEYEEVDKSVEVLTKAIECKSKYDNTYYALGKLFFKRKNYKEAIILFNKAFKISPHKIYKYNEAVSLIASDDKEEGILELKSIYTYPYEDEEINGRIALLLGRELALNGELEEGKKIIQLLLESSYESLEVGASELAECMYILGDYHKCIELYDEDNLYKDESWIGQYFYALKESYGIDASEKKMNEIEEEIVKNIYEEETNYAEWDSEEDCKEYVDGEKVRLNSIKECYRQVVNGIKPFVEIDYDIFYQCYYINCPRHYVG
ncbi:tetratricopeptide repeat family protein [Clostridium argentinense CDC 2741]|uniref:Tetratricopeptide repeat family protein n=1 Tax=Clostridium argentinense CDC 2741 TaxID=1418104 RepID=A0A0C1QXQ4_9CLOT|nr:tetratricopeptide repeat protein [Clostridium argentinense]ARC83412.1 hypothetical protein RSJ17_02075 [Clostridium argentinense]KIE45777.1 tetratricopeptide repeat family protein [Clostridium argentinense CDC 2741]NFF39142.1 tetratricopeptide repeat protein [Clostridium argentinense]NFP49554.1 tetratricopeptide repeat protein [Clostridium argentinense]NFP72257.1 tetratricopeptide repeat protein [Clostridium argentinense]